MKNIGGMVFFCFFAGIGQAQTVVEKHFGYSPGKGIKMDIQIADSIRIATWNKNEVYVRASVSINENRDNDRYKVRFDEAGDKIAIRAHFEDIKSNRSWNDSGGNCCTYRSTIIWEISIPENAGFSVETIDGNIIIEGKTEEVKARSISGFIDLAFPSSRKADLKMSTISGTIYTDLTMGSPTSKRGGNAVNTEMNGGGKRVDLETISGDIFLRKTQ
jgi:Putative adhesin